MKKKIVLILISIITTLSVISLVVFSKQEATFIKAKNESYSLVMNSSKNKLHDNTGSTAYSGETTIKTNLNNDVTFSYTDLMGLASTWHVAKSGGSFYNTTPVHGLESISLSFKTNGKEFKLYWSYTCSFTEEDSQTFTSSTSLVTEFNFNEDHPTYFKLVNTSESNLNISEVELSFSCVNEHPTISISSEDETMGTVSGSSGLVSPGDNASIIATPKQGYKFVGWYESGELVSSDSTYNFVMGYGDLNFVAHFTLESYNFVVQSESTSKGTVFDVSGSYDYLTPITIQATPKQGYSFNGWYRNSSLISSSNPYTFNMPNKNTTYIARFLANSYYLKLNNSNSSLGDVSSSGYRTYGSSVTITATPNIGSSFVGWFDSNDVLVSSLKSYTFTMPHEDLTFTAKFEVAIYSVNVTINDDSMGSVSGNETYTYDQEVTLVATPNEHYSFYGWYDGETLLSQESSYTFNMPNNSLNYEARFVQNHNLYVYSDDETKGTISSPSEWGEGFEVTVVATGNTGYALDYWYDDNLNEVSYDNSYTFVMPSHDVNLYAAFVSAKALTVTSSDTSKGTVTGGGYFIPGRDVSVSMSYISGFFKGWFDGNNQLVTKDESFTFTMPSYDYSLEARFYTQTEENRYGMVPKLSGSVITYGLYPQTNVSDSSIISALNNSSPTELNGWYLYNGDYYAKLIANPHSNTYKFDNGTKIVSGTTYWFKCEPITWKVLTTTSSGYYYVVSNVLLDVHRFNEPYQGLIDGHRANDYLYSELCDWLNSDFYNTAFSLSKKYVLTAKINGTKNLKVFLPTEPEYVNSSYGFSSYTSEDSTRCCKSTDWTRAIGGSIDFNYFVGGEHAYDNNGSYWTRTSYDDHRVYYVSFDGTIYCGSVDGSYMCVRPAMYVRLS